MGLDVHQASLIEERCKPGFFAERESASDRLGQTGHMSRDHYVDLMVIRALDDSIHRDGHTTAGAKHATKLEEAPHRIGKEHQPEIAQHGIETGIRERKRLPILDRD
jgi:hypothetical protein